MKRIIKPIKRAVIKAKICYYEWALDNVRKSAARFNKERAKFHREMSPSEAEWIACELTGFELDRLELMRRIEALNLELARLDWQR